MRNPDRAGSMPGCLAGIALVFAFTAGCATEQTVVVWEKPGATCDDVDAARAACAAEMEQARSPGVNRARLEADAAGARFVACMEERGFTWRTAKQRCDVPPDEGIVDPPAD